METTEVKLFDVTASPIGYNYNIRVDDDFEHPAQFANAIEIVNSATEDDYITIRLSSGGGSLSAVLGFIHALRSCPATIHTIVEGEASSAATFIVMCSDVVEVADHSTLLFHNVRYGISGKSADIADYVQHTEKLSDELMHDIYGSFFTEEEFVDLKRGKEFYYTKGEFLQKMSDMLERRNSETTNC